MTNKNCVNASKNYDFELFISFDILLMYSVKVTHKKDLEKT